MLCIQSSLELLYTGGPKSHFLRSIQTFYVYFFLNIPFICHFIEYAIIYPSTYGSCDQHKDCCNYAFHSLILLSHHQPFTIQIDLFIQLQDNHKDYWNRKRHCNCKRVSNVLNERQRKEGVHCEDAQEEKTKEKWKRS